MSARATLKREVRVAFSRRAQPLWFRVAKWVIAIGVGAMLWRTPYFWRVVVGALCLGLAVHLIWRWKTKAWTQPWGGWNDIETAGKK
jgi:hypothetical protein